MKRSFSLSELQRAIQTPEFASPRAGAAPAPTENEPSDAPLSLERAAKPLSTMRRSKSMDALNEFGEPSPSPQVGRAESVVLPSLSSLGLSFAAQQHGYEELKRGRGLHGKLPTSSSNSSLVGMVEGGGQDDETRGAASALMELFQHPVVACQPSGDTNSKQESETLSKPADMPSFAAPMMLPSLRELLAQSHPGHAGVSSAIPAAQKPDGDIAAKHMHGANLEPEQRPAERPAPPIKVEENGGSPPAPQGGNATGSPTPQPEGLDLGSPGGASAADNDAKHNKYCHFCQHVKVKRATSMLACENTECARRFCEHCLVTHLLHVVPADGRGLQEPLDGKWLCPICRKVCCCAIQSCSRAHRHCKAYRYRQRRAEQAARRSLAAAASDGSPQAPGFPAHHLHASPGPVAHGLDRKSVV